MVLRACQLLAAAVLSLGASVYAEEGSSDSNIFDNFSISGYANAHLMKHDGAPLLVGKDVNDTMFQVREFSFFVDVSLTSNLIFSTELELNADFSDDETTGGNDDFSSSLNFYYFDYLLSDSFDWDMDTYGAFSVRAGRILLPFLDYNLHKPNFQQSLMSQPFTAWQLSPVNNVPLSFQQFGWTDLGVNLHWEYETEAGSFWVVDLSVINGLGNDVAVLDSNSIQLDAGMMMPTVRPRDGLGNARSDWDDLSDVNDDKAVVLRAFYQLSDIPLALSFSWYKGKWDADEQHNLEMYGLGFDYKRNKFRLKGEWVNADVEQTMGINPVTATGPAMLNMSTGDYQMSSWFIEPSYKVMEYGEKNQNYLTLVARYDTVQTNDQAAFSPFHRDRVTAGLEWGFFTNMALRLEFQQHTLKDFSAAPAPFIAAGGSEKIDMSMASIIVRF